MKENRIDIYPSIWRVIGLILICTPFIFISFIMTDHPRAKFGEVDRYMCYIGITFFSLAILAGFVWLLLILLREPIAIIYDD